MCRISCAGLHEPLGPTSILEAQMVGSILHRTMLRTTPGANCSISSDTSPRGGLSAGADPVPY
jgi:hypothetical protein